MVGTISNILGFSSAIIVCFRICSWGQMVSDNKIHYQMPNILEPLGESKCVIACAAKQVLNQEDSLLNKRHC